MAKKVKKKNIRKTKKAALKVSPFHIYWEKQNYYLLAAGFILVIIGFYLMSVGPWDSTESLVYSSIFLVIGYVLIFPASIFFRKKDAEKSLQEEKIDAGKS